MKRWGVILAIGILIVAGSFAVLPGIAQAQEQVGLVPCGGTNQPACDLCHVFSLLNNILNFIFFRVVPPIAVVLIMIGGFFWFIAAGDPGKVKQGKDVFSAVVIGLILIYGAWIFVSTFLMWMGVAQWTGLGSWWQVDCKLGDLRYYESRAKAVEAGGPYGSPTCGTISDPWTAVHKGIDIGANKGTPVWATAEGKVIQSGPSGGSGNRVELQHPDGLITRYLHLSEIGGLASAVGREVKRGDEIGKVGGISSQATSASVNAWVNAGRPSTWQPTVSNSDESRAAGWSTGAHLHYEVLDSKGKPQNVNQGFGVCDDVVCVKGTASCIRPQ